MIVGTGFGACALCTAWCYNGVLCAAWHYLALLRTPLYSRFCVGRFNPHLDLRLHLLPILHQNARSHLLRMGVLWRIVVRGHSERLGMIRICGKETDAIAKIICLFYSLESTFLMLVDKNLAGWCCNKAEVLLDSIIEYFTFLPNHSVIKCW